MSRGHIITSYGSCLNVAFQFRGVDGEPTDITEDSFGILDCSPDVFREAAFTKTDPENGWLALFLPADQALRLKIGKVNWFRLRRTVAGCDDNTPEIEVEVV